MRNVTVASVLAQARQRADVEAETDRFPDSELVTYISASWAELYNEIVLLNNDTYLSSFSISIVSGQDTYALPSDFLMDRGVDFSTAGYTYNLSRWAFEEREVYQFVGNYTYGMPTAYRILGQNIIFKPAPNANSTTARLWYYPAPAVLTASDSVNGFAGFEEFLVADVALKILEKDARQSPTLPDMKTNALRVVKHVMSNPSRSHPDRVVRRYGRADLPRRPYPR